MTSRRQLLFALGAGGFAAPLGLLAQAPQRIARIGYLGAVSQADHAERLKEFRAGLRELGYVEGKNFLIEFRWAQGKNERLSELANDLVRLKVDVIVTHSAPGVRAAKQATTTIPIVIAQTGDAVASGLVASESRPGGNITGLSFFNPEIAAKRLELLKEVFPRIRRVALLVHPDNLGTIPATETAAKVLNLELQRFAVRHPDELERAFAAMSKQRVEAVSIVEAAMLIANSGPAANLANGYRIPSVGFIEVGEAGGLIAYGVKFPPMFRRAAVFVDKILKGANPGDLPIERATQFELIVNQKTAKALGVTIPQSMLLRADKVIE